LASTGYLSN